MKTSRFFLSLAALLFLTIASTATADAATFQDLIGGYAYGVSADGSTVVGSSDQGIFRWTASGGMEYLGHLSGGDWGYAQDVSADGSVVVGYSQSTAGFEAFRWTAGGIVGLGDLPGGDFYSLASAVSADGSMAVGQSKSAVGQEAFLWTQNAGMRSLNSLLGPDLPTGWTLKSARGMTVNGGIITVVGHGTNPSGGTEACIATLVVPEPAGLLSLASGLLLVAPALLRRRARH